MSLASQLWTKDLLKKTLKKAKDDGLLGGSVKEYTITIVGDGNSNEFIVTHNLGKTNVNVNIINAKNNTVCLIDYIIVDENNIKLIFANPPSTDNSYNIQIL